MKEFTRLNDAMRYIEAHLMEEIDGREIARIADCSEYHFRRMFSFLAGMPLTEYIRRRRLSVAAELLRTENMKIIDIALQAGYGTPDAFAKAFGAIHGTSPSKARFLATPLKAFPPMNFCLAVSGGNEMDYRIVEKGTFSIVGIRKTIPLVYEGKNPHMDSMWESLTIDDINELKSLSDTQPEGILCVSANLSDRREEGTELDQYIGVATTREAAKRWERLHVDAGTWAVFTIIGPFPRTLQNVWARIYSEWFPSSSYESTGGPEILWNESPDTSKPDYRCELWIPVNRTT